MVTRIQAKWKGYLVRKKYLREREAAGIQPMG
jgi:hypothetical protein